MASLNEARRLRRKLYRAGLLGTIIEDKVACDLAHPGRSWMCGSYAVRVLMPDGRVEVRVP